MSDYEFGYAEGQSEMYPKIERLEAKLEALEEAASDYIEGKHFPDCKALRVDLKNPRCTCGHDALAALLEKK